MNEKVITIFGSSFPKPGEEEYENAYKLGKLLAKKGFNVCTGGAQGIMDAVSKGAREEGKSAIGITLNIFSSTSIYLTKEIKCDTLFARIENLVNYGDGFIILPGGTGTLLELSAIWELINKNIVDRRPIVCLGGFWKSIVDSVESRLSYEKKNTGIIICCNSIEETVDKLNEMLNK